MRKVLGTMAVAALACASVVGAGAPAGAAPAATLPKPCPLVTSADITAALTAAGPALTPTSVATPAPSKPTNQGGFGPTTCTTAFYLPASVGGSVNVSALKVDKSVGCPPKGSPGKKTKIGKAKALLEPVPGSPAKVRDVTFPKGKACIGIEIFLSGGDSVVPASTYIALGKAALAAKG